ncbi:MAG: hypothetical protein R6V39_01565 [Desulfovibrionales bacterium]
MARKKQNESKDGDYAQRKANPHPDATKRKVLQNGMDGFVCFINALSENTMIQHNKHPLRLTLFAEIMRRSNSFNLDDWIENIDIAFDLKAVNVAFIQFLQTLFYSAGADEEGNIYFTPILKHLEDNRKYYKNTYNNWRQKHFNESQKNVFFKETGYGEDCRLDEMAIFDCANASLSIIGMVYSGYPKLLTKKKQVVEKTTDETTSKSKTKTRHYFKPENDFVFDLTMKNKKSIDEVQKESDLYMTDDFFNLDFTKPLDLVIQFLLRYMIEFRHIKRIKFCKNKDFPAIQCNNLLLEVRKDSKVFCSDECRKKYFSVFVEDPEKTRCRKRQISSVNNMFNTITKKISGITIKNPWHLNKEDCEDCRRNHMKVKGRQCIRMEKRNQDIFDTYYLLKPHMKIQ